MRKLLTALLLACMLLNVVAPASAASPSLWGEWTYVGSYEDGDFSDETGNDSREVYTFTKDKRWTCAVNGKQTDAGQLEVKDGVYTVLFNGTKPRTALLLDTGYLVLGNHESGLVFTRNGKLPSFKKVEAGMTKDGLSYEQLPDGTIMITGHKSNDLREGKPIDLKLPQKIGGATVSTIGDLAFYGNRLLRSVTIPKTVRYIHREAFSECANLQKVTIPESVNAIGKYVFNSCTSLADCKLPKSLQAIDINPFSGCTALREIVLDKANRWYHLDGGALIETDSDYLIAFPAGSSAESYSVPDYIVRLETAAFMGCGTLRSVEIPSSVTRIRSYVFEDSGLTSITIPAAVTRMDSNPFNRCRSLESVAVEEGNKTFYSVDGVLFDRESATLIYYPMGAPASSYTIPEGTKIIGADAFLRCNLSEVIIPGSVTNIEDYAFYGMEHLNNIIIPDSVTELGAYTFGECRALTDISIPASVREIKGCTFIYTPLRQLVVAEGTAIDETAFDDCEYEVEVIYQ